MTLLLFILGLPGSGKSTAARHIVDYDQQHYKGWSTVRLNDYDILHKMSRADIEGKRFSLTKFDGFDVLDYSVLNEALRELKKRIMREIGSYDRRKLIIVEFARDDYSRVLKKFFSGFLKNAFFLFIDADVSVCQQRIRDRVAKPPAERVEDDRYVSPFIFETYYQRDRRNYVASVATQLEKGFGVAESHIKVIEDSNLTLDNFQEEIDSFIESIFQSGRQVQQVFVRDVFRSKHPTGSLASKLSRTRTPLSGVLL